jgi:hypothetical protein
MRVTGGGDVMGGDDSFAAAKARCVRARAGGAGGHALLSGMGLRQLLSELSVSAQLK